MPRIDRIFSLEIKPEHYLEACSYNELMEINLLLDGCIQRKKKMMEDERAASLMTDALNVMSKSRHIDVLKERQNEKGTSNPDNSDLHSSDPEAGEK